MRPWERVLPSEKAHVASGVARVDDAHSKPPAEKTVCLVPYDVIYDVIYDVTEASGMETGHRHQTTAGDAAGPSRGE